MRGDALGIDLLHMERHEQVPKRVQRQHRNPQIPGCGKNVKIPALPVCGNALYLVIERTLGRSQGAIGVELVHHVGVLHDDSAVARQRAVADPESEQEIPRHDAVPEQETLIEYGPDASGSQLNERLEVLACWIQGERKPRRSNP